jgi:phosphoglycolate phosphatase
MATAKFSSVRALIFDLDGTLIDSKQDLIHSVNAMLRELRRSELAEDTIAGYIGHGAPQLVGSALGKSVTPEKLAALPMAVLTNKPVRISVRILDALGLSKYFRAIYGGNSFAAKKPDPLGANTILREFRAAPEEALLIGDSEVDIQTARHAGTLAAAVNYGFGIHDRAANPADVYLDQFADLLPLLIYDRA